MLQVAVAVSPSVPLLLLVDLVKVFGLVLAVFGIHIRTVAGGKGIKLARGLAVEVDRDQLLVHLVLLLHFKQQSVRFCLLLGQALF